MKKNTPQPVPTNVICSICGEPWHEHKEDAKGEVSTLECVRLLKARVAASPTIIYRDRWSGPYWSTVTTPYINVSSSGSISHASGISGATINCVNATPTVALASAAA